LEGEEREGDKGTGRAFVTMNDEDVSIENRVRRVLRGQWRLEALLGVGGMASGDASTGSSGMIVCGSS
jgi:hypothetical protein